jgi:hypothetical protein
VFCTVRIVGVQNCSFEICVVDGRSGGQYRRNGEERKDSASRGKMHFGRKIKQKFCK